jgi:uncharacterized protein YqgV (UPF0045/DUF77 family)
MRLIAEFSVEPFIPGAPGAHVIAALSAAQEAGASVEVGPFGNTLSAPEAGFDTNSDANSDANVVLSALHAAMLAALKAGATRISSEIRVVE